MVSFLNWIAIFEWCVVSVDLRIDSKETYV